MPFSAQNLNENQQKIAALISAKADELGVDRDFALALAHAESSLNQFDEKNKVLLGPPPKNKKGERAIGVMQVKPSTAKDYGFSSADLLDPEKNITAGVTYLKNLIDQSEGDKAVAAAKYNWGPGRDFFKTGEGELPEETVKYLRSIKGFGGFGDATNPERATPEQTPPPEEPVEVPPAAEIPVAEPTAETPKSPEEIQKEETEGRRDDALTAAALGGTAGLGAGYVRKQATAVEDRILREEKARAAAARQIAAMEAKGAPPKAPGNLPAPTPPAPEKPAPLKGAQLWVKKLGNNIPDVIAAQAETMDKVSPRGGQTLINQDAAAMEKIRQMGEGRQRLIGEGMGQMMVPPEVAEERARAAAAAEANTQRLAAIERDTNAAREARLAAQEANSPLNRARAAITQVAESPVGRFGTRAGQAMFRYAPVVGYGMAGASMGKSAEEMRQALERKEYIDALLAAAQMATTGASMVPPLAPFAVPADIGLGAYRMGKEYFRD